MERRLVAILAADVVGYTRLMEADEAGTLAVLKARRKEVLEPLVVQHQGRIFKVTGDGVLVEFAGAVNAVQCAVDLQQGMATANGGQPEERHIVLRIGVNLGDVMVEGGDLYGDGVNIAARLEAIAEPGGILASATVYEYVKNKIKVAFDDLGPQSLRNIAEPLRTYRVADIPTVAVNRPKTGTEKPSIAVLPLARSRAPAARSRRLASMRASRQGWCTTSCQRARSSGGLSRRRKLRLPAQTPCVGHDRESCFHHP